MQPHAFLATPDNIFYKVLVMADRRNARIGSNKMMLGFIVRRCAADLGHAPSPDEFAAWANGQNKNGRSYCIFGKPITASAAKVMFGQPGRLVTVRPDGVENLRKSTV